MDMQNQIILVRRPVTIIQEVPLVLGKDELDTVSSVPFIENGEATFVHSVGTPGPMTYDIRPELPEEDINLI